MPRRAEDLTGNVYEELTAETYLGHRTWRCRCTCGNTRDVLAHVLKEGSVKRCAECQAKLRKPRAVERQPYDLTGQIFHDLTAIEYLGHRVWLTRCVCGNTREVGQNNLVSGHVKRCADCTKALRERVIQPAIEAVRKR